MSTDDNYSISDSSQRQDALNGNESFIVQAPAGSGKTTLLIQRMLVLLSQVKEPEEILAITFTRKAAEEMRSRLLQALTDATSPQPPADPYQRFNYDLAKKVLNADRARPEHKRWNLLQNPDRLRLRTIDSFCHYLVQRLPLQSSFGAPLEPSENSNPLYEEATYELMKSLDDREFRDHHPEVIQSVQNLLLHFGGNRQELCKAICATLDNRALWWAHLPTLLQMQDNTLRHACQENLKTSLYTFYAEQLNILQTIAQKALDSGYANDILRLARTCHNNMLADGYDYSWILPLSECQNWPQQITLGHLGFFRALRTLFCSDSTGVWKMRSRLMKSSGFIDSAKCNPKKEFKDIRIQFEEDLLPLINQAIILDSALPDNTTACYSEQQFAYLHDAAIVIVWALAHLKLVFSRYRCCDHTEISLRALEALGTDEAPTPLAQQLDHEICHILVDEYQDTSNAQYQLLQRLVAEWHQGDGRTIFLVGDPMQSIYRFRQADVGVYLRTRDSGIGPTQPKSLVLRTNFRSSDNLIAWFNSTFASIFPKDDDINTSAIRYERAESPRCDISTVSPQEVALNELSDSPETEIRYHLMVPEQGKDCQESENEYIVELIRQERELYPDKQIAVLLRKNKQGNRIASLLRPLGIPYQALDMEELQNTEVPSDLLCLTQALLHLGDTIAWLALLRSPLVGLNDGEITRLMEASPHNYNLTVWERLNEDDLWARDIWRDLPTPQLKELQARCHHLTDALSQALSVRYEQPLSRWVRGCWVSLGGPLTLKNAQEHELAEEFFAFLRQQENLGYIDRDQLLRDIADLKATPQVYPPEANPVQLMTMHGAKGLEFDTVILPYLNEGAGGSNIQGLWRVSELSIKDPQTKQDTLVALYQGTEPKPNSDNFFTPAEATVNAIDANSATSTTDTDCVTPLCDALNAKADENESKRLLYVAATRAKQRLHLVSVFNLNQEDTISDVKIMMKDISALPTVGERIKELVEQNKANKENKTQVSESEKTIKELIEETLRLAHQHAEANRESDKAPQPYPLPDDYKFAPLCRLSSEGRAYLNQQCQFPPSEMDQEKADDFDGTYQSVFGTDFHEVLQIIASQSNELIPEAAHYQDIIERVLAGSSWTHDDNYHQYFLDNAPHLLQTILNDPQGRWAIGPHQDSRCEQELVDSRSADKTERYRLDRCFVEGGQHHIIDYKTGKAKAEYHAQLNTYAKLYSQAYKVDKVRLTLCYVDMDAGVTLDSWDWPDKESNA